MKSSFEQSGEESFDFGTEENCPEPEETPESVAKYNPLLKSPQCGFPNAVIGDFGEVIRGPLTEALTHCSTVGSAPSGPLSLELLQAKTRSGEPNGPNTAHGLCGDGDSGVYKTDESIESVSVIASLESGVLKQGGMAKVTAEVYSYLDGAEDRIDFYYYTSADTTKESGGKWEHISTVEPEKGGLIEVHSDEFELPVLELVTIRTVIRWSGEDDEATSCPTDTGSGNKCNWYKLNDAPGCPEYGNVGADGWPLGTA